MTKSDKIGHFCIMSRANIDHTVTAHLAEQFGYLRNLEQVAIEGGYIDSETEEAIGMENSAKDLLRLAKEILDVRNRLLANCPPRLKIVS